MKSSILSIGDPVTIQLLNSEKLLKGHITDKRKRVNGSYEYKVNWADGKMLNDWFLSCEFD